MRKVKSISIRLFKAKALQFIKDARLTKPAEEVASIVPMELTEKVKMGDLKGTASELEDIIGPLDHSKWEVLK